jgi:hypothetical protein
MRLPDDTKSGPVSVIERWRRVRDGLSISTKSKYGSLRAGYGFEPG